MIELKRNNFHHTVKRALKDENFGCLESVIIPGLLAELRSVPEGWSTIADFPEQDHPDLLAKAFLLPVASALANLAREEQTGTIVLPPLLGHVAEMAKINELPRVVKTTLEHVRLVLSYADNFSLSDIPQALVEAVIFVTRPLE